MVVESVVVWFSVVCALACKAKQQLIISKSFFMRLFFANLGIFFWFWVFLKGRGKREEGRGKREEGKGRSEWWGVTVGSDGGVVFGFVV